MGYGLTVIRAIQDIAAGKSKEEVIAGIKDNIERIQHIFIVGNFEMLKREVASVQLLPPWVIS